MCQVVQSLFENRRQATKVRVWLWLSMVVCVAALIYSAVVFQTYGMSEGDGAALRSFSERLAVAGFVALLGLLFLGCMLTYVSLYVVQIDRKGDELFVNTMSPSGFGIVQHVISVAALVDSKYHHGRFSVLRMTGSPGRGVTIVVDAPWITIHSEGRRLPFLLDVQAEYIDVVALGKLIEAAMADWNSDRA